MFPFRLRCHVSQRVSPARDKASGTVASQAQVLLLGQQLCFPGGCLLLTDQGPLLAMQAMLKRDGCCPVVCSFAAGLASVHKSVTFYRAETCADMVVAKVKVLCPQAHD